MSKELKVYSANQISFNLGGAPIESGRGDDEFISIKKPNQRFTYKASVDGEGTRSEDMNTYREVTMTLMRTASGNLYLSALHALDEASPGGAGIVPIMIRDRQGLSLFASPQAWIVSWPDDAHAKEAPTVQWVLGVHNPEQIIGGN